MNSVEYYIQTHQGQKKSESSKNYFNILMNFFIKFIAIKFKKKRLSIDNLLI